MISVGTLTLNRLMGILYTLKPLTIFDAYDFQHSVTCLKVFMFESFGCSKFFNFVVVTFIISKNFKILKILDNNRPKICKALRSENMKNENLSEIL